MDMNALFQSAIANRAVNSPSSVKSDDSSPARNSGSGSPPPNCAICLGKCKNRSFTDSCLHQFCFECLLTWSKVKPECPLCKQAFRSIIHNVRSNHQYEEYLVVQNEASRRIDIDRLATAHRFRYRTTLTLPRRDSIAIQQLLRHYPLMADVLGRPLSCRRREPAAFRRNVYRHNLRARPLPDFTGRYRDCSPDFYRFHPSQMHRLVAWLNRELHYLLNENLGHITYVIERIMELLPQYHIKSREFREAMFRYFGDRTEHFLHELFCYASTPYDIQGYDSHIQYTTDTRISTMVNEIISSSDSEATVDSDIVMISSSGPTEAPPGPSRVPGPVYPLSCISQPAIVENVIPIETISHSDTDDDEVMVVGYIKPPQDRTPEVVDLLNSDSDVVVQDVTDPPPSTSAVRLTVKRRRGGGAAAARSDSDSSSVQSPKRRRSTSSAGERYTPDPPVWHRSDCPCSHSDLTSTGDEPAPAPRNKTKKRASAATRNRRRHEKLSKRSQRTRDTGEAHSDTERRSSRKSHSGKGVKSSSRRNIPEDRSDPTPSPETTEPPPLVLDQPGTSATGETDTHRDGSRRRHDSRETRRLRSVVNVISSSSHRNTDESNSSANCNIYSNTAGGGSSLWAELDSIQNAFEAEMNRSASCSSAWTALAISSPLNRPAASSSDPEDDIPLNLTLQKKPPPALT